MARTDTLGHFLTDVADAIRDKKGTVNVIAASDFDTEIENIPSGGEGINLFFQTTEPTTKDGVWVNYSKIKTGITADYWDTTTVYPTLPYNTQTSGVARVGDYFYVFGGPNNATKAYKYDTINNTISTISDIPMNCNNSRAVAVDGIIYLVVCGDTEADKKNIYSYNPATDTYTFKTALPYPFLDHCVTAVNGYIYIAGGKANNVANLHYKYDPVNNTYVALSNLPINWYNGCSCTDGENIYYISPYTKPTTMYKYTVATDTFTTYSTVPYTSHYAGCCYFDGNIYVFGGLNYTQRAYKYDILFQTWTQLPNIPYQFFNSPAEYYNGKIYLFGGERNKTKLQVFIPSRVAYTDNTYGIDDYDNVYINGSYGTNYPNNSLVIISTSDGKTTKLYDISNINDTVGSKITGVIFYNSTHGDLTFLSYYGDGTQWVEM